MSDRGVDVLRRRRGDEQVTFGDVADHLEDFVARRPASRGVVEELALFLARVEDADHRHEGEGPTLSA